MRSWILLAVAVVLAAACTRFPELDRQTDKSVQALPYPALLPYDQLQAATTAPPPADPAPALTAAADELRRKAAAQQAQN
ncbi:MAG: hypothetical protein U1E48_00980 [Paracoccaceae bacterium]